MPGLAAKPIIDILVGVENLESSRACFEPSARLDYMQAPYLPEKMHWLCKPGPSRRSHHVHPVPVGSRLYAEELAFRDLLSFDADAAKEYAELKRTLAARFERDREGYTEAKGEFIRLALGRATRSQGRRG